MSLILITVESDDPGRNYEQLEAELRGRGDDCRPLRNTWIVDTNDTPQQIFQLVQQYLFQKDDRCIIAPLSEPWIPLNAESKDDCRKRRRG